MKLNIWDLVGPIPHLRSIGYGSYYHEALAIQAKMNPLHVFNKRHIAEMIEKFEKSDSCSFDSMDYALNMFGYYHELRHLHDLLGTQAGVYFFLMQLRMLQEFDGVCRELARNGLEWKLPVSKWVQEANCPIIIKKLVNSHRMLEAALCLYYGRVPGFRLEGLQEERTYLAYTDSSDFYFPYQGVLMRTNRGSEYTEYRPVGLEALTESAAHVYQKVYLERYWTKEVLEAYEQSKRHVLREFYRPDGTPLNFNGQLQPYDLAELVISAKFSSLDMPIYGYHPYLVMASIDAAMWNSFITITDPSKPIDFDNIVMKHPGTCLLEVTETEQWLAGLKVGTDWGPSKQKVRDLRNMVTNIASMIKPSISPIETVGAYVINEIILPLLDLRLRDGNEAFWNIQKYMNNLNDLPAALISLIGGEGPYTGKDADADLINDWISFQIISTQYKAVMADQQVLNCPRAFGLIPGLTKFELNPGGHGCDYYVSKRKCLRWATGRLSVLPDCSFATFIDSSRFEQRGDRIGGHPT